MISINPVLINFGNRRVQPSARQPMLFDTDDSMEIGTTQPPITSQTELEAPFLEEYNAKTDEYLAGNGSFLLVQKNNPKRIRFVSHVAVRSDSKVDVFLTRLLEKLDNDDPLKLKVIEILGERRIPKGNNKEFYARTGHIVKVLLDKIVKDKDQLGKLFKGHTGNWFFKKTTKLIALENFIWINSYHNENKLRRVRKSLEGYKTALDGIKTRHDSEARCFSEQIQEFLDRMLIP